AVEEHYAEGQVLFSEGSPAQALYLILRGKVSLEKRVQLGRTGTARQATIDVSGPWQAVGWSSLVVPYEYTSSAVCLEDTLVLRVSGVDLRQLMEEQPEAGYELMGRAASIIRARLASTTALLTYFLSIVSHELKRPLAAVENYLQITLGGYAGEITDKQRRLLERSSLRLSDLRSLISDLLDFARIQPDQIQADFEWVDPKEIGAEATEEVRLAASQKNIRLKVVGPLEYKPIVGARRRLRQVLSNLLANAVKFSPEGSTVTLSAQDEPEALLLEVRDEGIGIPAQDQEHVFDDFFRGSNVEEVGGTGLGLSITRKTVDAHEGQIAIESPYAKGVSGTRVVVKIPRSLSLPRDRGCANRQADPQPAVEGERQGT
ncbi:MAG TPA: HAMP domain-containing sensor histidine kinase, partial [Anaerolineales bacterium]|nr:HAMP domain-containing sensor histidine kinase [Anaerolineales bacterium]